jgi:hypothetical protein
VTPERSYEIYLDRLEEQREQEEREKRDEPEHYTPEENDYLPRRKPTKC